MKRYVIGICLLALAALVLATGPATARETETINQSYPVGRDARLSLKNVNGDVTIEGSDADRFEVTAVKSADSKKRLDDVEVRLRMDGDHLSIEVDMDEHLWSRHNHESLRVDFTVRVPRSARIDAVELVNGDLELRNITGDVDASSVNGDVTGEALGGSVELSAVNGGVSLLANGNAESIDLSSVNGGVKLVLPKKIDARIEANTVHGSIRSSDGLDVDTSSFVGSSLKGTIGKGGMKIELDTVNGSIEIRREGDAPARGREED